MSKFEITKYERARIYRHQSFTTLSNGAPPMVRVDGLIDVMAIAVKDLENIRCPFYAEKKLPDRFFIRYTSN